MESQFKPVLEEKTRLCYVPVTTRIVTNWLFNFCIWKFSHINNIDNEWLRIEDYIWKEDDTVNEIMNKGILIQKAFDYKPQDAQKRPALIIKAGETIVGPRIAIGDTTKTPTNLLGQANPNTTAMLGDSQQMVAIGGSAVIYAVHHTAGIAEILGEEIFYSLIDYKLPTKKILKLDEFRPASLGSVTKIEEFKDNWACPINVSFKFRRDTIVRQEAPLLKAISVQLNKQ